MTTFADRCRQSTTLSVDDRQTLIPIDGAQHLVLVGKSRVWRFPRGAPDCARITEMAQRINAAARLGAPRVISVVPGAPGDCHLVLTRTPGTSLLRAQAAGRPVDRAVLAALRRLRGTSQADWPFAQVRWVQMWSGFVATAHARAAQLPPDQVSTLLASAEQAAAVAADAPIRIVHGDLASDNIMVADSGALAGILDWDGAILGDPAIDTAAALHVLDPVSRQAALAADTELVADLQRWVSYRDTWTLQNLLWKQGLTPPLWGGTAH
jgi:aminoglycoside phosphotransferase (APT) family kinase protein